MTDATDDSNHHGKTLVSGVVGTVKIKFGRLGSATKSWTVDLGAEPSRPNFIFTVLTTTPGASVLPWGGLSALMIPRTLRIGALCSWQV